MVPDATVFGRALHTVLESERKQRKEATVAVQSALNEKKKIAAQRHKEQHPRPIHVNIDQMHDGKQISVLPQSAAASSHGGIRPHQESKHDPKKNPAKPAMKQQQQQQQQQSQQQQRHHHHVNADHGKHLSSGAPSGGHGPDSRARDDQKKKKDGDNKLRPPATTDPSARGSKSPTPRSRARGGNGGNDIV